MFLRSIVVVALVLISSATAYAETSSVSTSIKVESSSGGNSASGGTLIESSSESHVHVETYVNGELVEYIDETSTDGSIHVESLVSTQNGETEHSSGVTYSEKQEATHVSIGDEEHPTGVFVTSTTSTSSLTEAYEMLQKTLKSLSAIFVDEEENIHATTSSSTDSSDISEETVEDAGLKAFINKLVSYVFTLFKF